MNKKEISVLTALLFTIVFSVCSQYIVQANNIKENTLRLHIIANSNSEYDQQQKLMVRDKILEMEDILPVNVKDFAQAMEFTQKNIPLLEERINKYLDDINTDYDAKCSIEDFYFDTTKYDGFALPQGEYKAITVRLGQAEGKNWWCVMYPALCSQSVGEITLENQDDFIKTDEITARFKIIEIYENIKMKFSDKKYKKYNNI